MANKSGIFSRDGRELKATLEKATDVVEQRIFFYGNKAAKEAATLVLEEAKRNCPVETGHLRNSGNVVKVKAGETHTGTDEGLGDATGSYFRSRSKKTTYIVSFNTMKVSHDGKNEFDSDTPVRIERVGANGKVYVQKISAKQRGYESLNNKFNYAIIVHENESGRGFKFLENAYNDCREEVQAIIRENFGKVKVRSSL